MSLQAQQRTVRIHQAEGQVESLIQMSEHLYAEEFRRYRACLWSALLPPISEGVWSHGDTRCDLLLFFFS